MMLKLREQARGVFGWIIIGAIILVLSVFGFGALNFFVQSEPTVATVGGTEILQSELMGQLDRQRRQILQSMGPDADPAAIDEAGLRERVLSSLIERTLLLEGARRAGMAAPEPALDDVILSTPEFQVDGRFDPDRFRIVLGGAGMSPIAFRDALGEDLLVNQLSAGVGDTAFVTPSELTRMAMLIQQRRDVAWLTFAPGAFEEDAEALVEADDVRAWYEDNPDRYRAPEQLSVRYLRLDRDTLAAEVEVSEEEIDQAYAAEVAAFEGREQRRSAHILLTVDDERSEAGAIALASSLAERIRGGESFADLAREFSDDPGSASQGGDLGLATRDTFVPPFEQALFALEPGELSEPVVTDFGVHLIRLDAIERTEPPSEARLRPVLEARIRDRAAQLRFDELRATLETVAYEAADLEEPAERLDLEIMEAGPFTRDGGEDLFANDELIDAAFSPDVLGSGYNSPVIEAEDGVLIVLRVAEHAPERLRDFAEVETDVRSDLVFERSRELADAAADEVLSRLQSGASAADVAVVAGLEWQRRDGLQRNDREVPFAVIREAFRMPQPPGDGRSVSRAETVTGDIAVVALTAVSPGELETLSDSELAQLRQLVRSRVGGTDFEAFRDALRRDLKVTRRATVDIESEG